MRPRLTHEGARMSRHRLAGEIGYDYQGVRV
jgi:hypothetical protein